MNKIEKPFSQNHQEKRERAQINKIRNEKIRYNPRRLNQEEIENMNRLITSTKMETVIKFPTKVQDQMSSQANSIKHLEQS